MTQSTPASAAAVPPPPPRSERRRRTVAVVAAVVLAAVALSFGIGRGTDSPAKQASATRTDRGASSGSGGSAVPTTTARSRAFDQSAASGATKTGELAPDAGGSGGTVTATPLAVSAAKIVKTASIDLEVRKGAASTTFSRLTVLASGSGGFVAQQQTSEAGGSPSGTITLRVPSDAFEQVLTEARKLGKVQSATTGGQDVTNEYTDVEGRLKSLTDERAQLQLVLGAANNVSDILSVRDRLTTVQTEIEQLQGRKNVLDDQVSLATLAVSVHERGDNATPVPNEEPTGFTKAWHDAADGFNSSVQAIIAGSGRTLVVLLVGLVLFLLGRVALRVGRRHLVDRQPEVVG